MLNLNQFVPDVEIILSALGLWLVKQALAEGKKLIPSLVEKTEVEIGQVRFNRMEKAASLMWASIKKETALGTFAGNEVSYLQGRLMARYPKITKADMNLISNGVSAVAETVVTQMAPALESDVNEVVEEVAKEPVSTVEETPVEKVLDKVDTVVAGIVNITKVYKDEEGNIIKSVDITPAAAETVEPIIPAPIA